MGRPRPWHARVPAAALRLVAPPMLCCALVLSAGIAWSGTAAGLGRVEGKVIASDSGEPIPYADVVLIPADSTRRPVGTLSNADGTFLLEAPAGLYDLNVRALSYRRRIVTQIRIEEGKLLSIPTALEPEAIAQPEIVVEARLQQNTEQAMLAERRRAATVGDAISAEQVRRSGDRDAADVLKRVTGVSVADGKYVYVRGLGERYSSTEVDGVRLTSPEPNKRVVPLDLVPVGLLDHISVQKTYTADRPGEFGAGDVQVYTRNFPGKRVFSLSITQGVDEGTTFGPYQSYAVDGGGSLGFGASARAMPDLVNQIAAGQPVAFRGTDPTRGFTADTLAMLGNSFDNTWSPVERDARTNGSIQQNYGDEFRLFGRSLGIVQSASLLRSYNYQEENERLYATQDALVYDYGIQRSVASSQFGGMGAISYRLAPSHTLHARGLYTRSADDEVRVYEGVDYNQLDFTDSPQTKRATRLRYVERSVASGSLNGDHEFASLKQSKVAWRLTTSGAHRVEPDRRETVYDRGGYYDGNDEPVYFWTLSGRPGPTREFGDLDERGWGADGSWSVPYRLRSWGGGRMQAGFSFQRKDRDQYYRRFRFAAPYGTDTSAPPESLFQDGAWNGDVYGAQIEENTLSQDNYVAAQAITAGFVNVEVPMGPRLRGVFGVRLEHALQEVRCFDLFEQDRITAEGRIDEAMWLPAANLRLSLGERTGLRLAASRTLSRPDLNEFSPSPSLEYVGGLQVTGNENLHQAKIQSYDVRIETFPSASEVLAAGYFRKDLYEPIERVILGGSAPVLAPENADRGRNQGVELEARATLGRLWAPLQRWTLTTNATWIESQVRLKPHLTEIGTQEHPLEGQPDYVVNGTLSCAFPSHRAEISVLLNAVGRRLETLGLYDRPDIYEEPSTTLDVSATWRMRPALGFKATGRNLLDTEVRRVQGDLETFRARSGRSYSLAVNFGT